MASRYFSRTYRTEAAWEDLCTQRLVEVGTRGIEVSVAGSDAVQLLAYFSTPPPPHQGLPERVGEQRGHVELLAEGWLEERDWQEEFRRHAVPIQIGDRFLVDPGELDRPPPVADGRIVLRLPTRTAFGTGSHETTQLTLEWLEQVEVENRTILDVGSGSGVLSLAAQRLGARCVIGFDLDLPSALMSGQYERLNREPSVPRGRIGLYAGTSGAICPKARFDLLMVNVLPHRIASELGWLAGRVRSGGLALVSGVLDAEENSVLAAWRALGLDPVGRRQRGEWVAWKLTKGGSQ